MFICPSFRLFAGVLAISAVASSASAGTPIRKIERDSYQDLFFKTPPLAPIEMTGRDGPRTFEARRSMVRQGRALRYRARLEETIVDIRGKPAASLFATSYIADPAPRKRPILFAFNGGPGVASAAVNFTIGPRKLASEEPAKLHDASNGLVDNPATLLTTADLVFIDPAETGYSRVLPGVDAKPFLTQDGDAQSVSAVILQWLKRHDRLDSPFYIFGESYGSIRAIAVARDLVRSQPSAVPRGIVLAGTSLTISDWGRGPNPMLLANRIPMMASLAYHYGKIDKQRQTWDQAVEKAREFARTEYLPALMKGYRLDQSEFDRIVSELPGVIGIPATYFRDAGALTVANFNALLLKEQRLVLDFFNGLYAYPEGKEAGHSYEAYRAAFGALAKELNADIPESYRVVNADIYSKWDGAMTGDATIDLTLAKLMQEQRRMRLLVMQGRYDTLTDLGTTEFMIEQAALPQDRYSIAYYDGGHSISSIPEAVDPIRELLSSHDRP